MALPRSRSVVDRRTNIAIGPRENTLCKWLHNGATCRHTHTLAVQTRHETLIAALNLSGLSVCVCLLPSFASGQVSEVGRLHCLSVSWRQVREFSNAFSLGPPRERKRRSWGDSEAVARRKSAGWHRFDSGDAVRWRNGAGAVDSRSSGYDVAQ